MLLLSGDWRPAASSARSLVSLFSWFSLFQVSVSLVKGISATRGVDRKLAREKEEAFGVDGGTRLVVSTHWLFPLSPLSSNSFFLSVTARCGLFSGLVSSTFCSFHFR